MSARELRNFVNGEYVESRSAARLDLVDPATEKVYATSPVSDAGDVDDAYAAASTAFEQWGES
ncbi:MAG TPA: aldehyde dehydrogenase family protein, partial [Cryobacterium sp.]|nr:aldehyde dehydrogenase family protein [Cryobacterium sp.]